MREIKIVEIREGRVFTVVVEYAGRYLGYDFEWSKDYGCYLYHLSSSVTSWTITEDEYWASPDAKFDIYPERGKIRREHFDVSRLFEDNIEGEVEYCSQCDDWIMLDDLCIHLHWLDNGGLTEIEYCCKELSDYDVDHEVDGDDKCPYCGVLSRVRRC